MFNREKILNTGEKITITSRLNPDGTESIFLCISSKDKEKGFIVDLAIPLSTEEIKFVAGSLQSAELMSRLKSKEK